MRNWLKFLSSIALCLALAACGGPSIPGGDGNTPTITSFSATPATIQAGESSTLSWTVSKAASLSISHDVGDVTGKTSTTVSPTQTTTYTLTATNGAGSVSEQTEVTVIASDVSSIQLIDEALVSGDIDYETALTYKVFAVFNDPRLPPEFRGNDEGRDGTLIIAELIQSFDTLSQSTQGLLEPFLLTPAQPGSWYELRGSTGSGLVDTQAIQWGTVGTQNGKVKIWYHPADDASGQQRAQTIAGAIDNTIWTKLTSLMREPLPDCGAACPKGGGDEHLDIYITSSNVRAYAMPFECCSETPAYIVLDRPDSLAIVGFCQNWFAVGLVWPSADTVCCEAFGYTPPRAVSSERVRSR